MKRYLSLFVIIVLALLTLFSACTKPSQDTTTNTSGGSDSFIVSTDRATDPEVTSSGPVVNSDKEHPASEELYKQFMDHVAWVLENDSSLPPPENALWYVVDGSPRPYGFAYEGTAPGCCKIIYYMVLWREDEPTTIQNSEYDLTIPAQINGLRVTEVAPWSFYKRTLLSEVTLPDTLETIREYAFARLGYRKMVIPSSVKEIENNAFWFSGDLTEFSVAEQNPFFCAEEGVLYNKNQTVLVAYPEGNARETFVIPDTVTKIEPGAFGWYAKALKSVTIPASVVDFPDQNLFDGHEVNREENERLLLYVPAGSAAEAYAKKHNLRYELIGAPNN